MNGLNEMNDILILLIGAILGFIIYHFTLGKKQAGTQQKEMENAKAELEQYKAKVNSHFTNSAELMGQVASSYQALYSHMADQSHDLLNDTDLPPFPLLETAAEKAEETTTFQETPVSNLDENSTQSDTTSSDDTDTTSEFTSIDSETEATKEFVESEAEDFKEQLDEVEAKLDTDEKSFSSSEDELNKEVNELADSEAEKAKKAMDS